MLTCLVSARLYDLRLSRTVHIHVIRGYPDIHFQFAGGGGAVNYEYKYDDCKLT